MNNNVQTLEESAKKLQVYKELLDQDHQERQTVIEDAMKV